MTGAAADALVGALVAGRYRVVRLLGEGGMGRVFLADQELLGRRVALKVLREEHQAEGGPRRERFVREARAASQVTHPGLATVYDFGSHNGQLYIAMEYLPGVTLAGLMTANPDPLPGTRIADLLAQVCDVLVVTHRAGILHRDLKPENVMLMGPKADRVKVVDFGLSLLLRAHEERITADGLVTGTPGYMAPEQCQGRDGALSGRSDLYAVGVMLYELLCGELPFQSASAADVMLQHVLADPVPPSDRAPRREIPPALEALALWAMSKDPADRPPDAATMAEELRAAAALMADPGTADDASCTGEPPRIGPPRQPATAPVAVVLEPADRPVRDRLLALLRAQQTPCRGAAGTLEQELLAPSAIPLVLDLGDAPQATLARVRELLGQATRPLRPVVVVGPGTAIHLMADAISLGLSDYVARADVHHRLAPVVHRAAGVTSQ